MVKLTLTLLQQKSLVAATTEGNPIDGLVVSHLFPSHLLYVTVVSESKQKINR